ncbi:MAG: hypothetical protein ACYTA3_13060 [Planctomycetota bacterium]
MSPSQSRQRGLLLVISGPSGTGKTTIARAVESRLDGTFSVSATTRPQSQVETGGRDYDFLSEPEFQEKVRSGALPARGDADGRGAAGHLGHRRAGGVAGQGVNARGPDGLRRAAQ